MTVSVSVSTPDPSAALSQPRQVVQLDPGSEIKLRLIKNQDEPKRGLELALERLSNPFILPLVTSLILGLGGAAWAWGSNKIESMSADSKQAMRLQTEIRVRVSDARDQVEGSGTEFKDATSQRTFFAGNVGQKLVLDTLGWKEVSAGYHATFPEFNQRTLFSMLRELELVAGSQVRKKAGVAECILTETVKEMKGAGGLDIKTMDERLKKVADLVALE